MRLTLIYLWSLAFLLCSGVRALTVEAPRTPKRDKPALFYFSELDKEEPGNPTVDEWCVITTAYLVLCYVLLCAMLCCFLY